MIPLLLNLALFSPFEVVLAGLSNGTDTLVSNTTQVLGFIAGESNYALNSVRLFGNGTGTASITFRLNDAGGNQLAFGGTYLNSTLSNTGTDFSLSPSPIGAYTLAIGTGYQLQMDFSGSLYMYEANAGVYQTRGWQESASPGFKYSLDVAAVPEPGTLLLGILLALFGVGVWGWRVYV